MIGRLTGTVEECRPGQLLLDVGGVGYALHIPLSTFYALSGQENGAATLHVHTHVREDAIQLYGFISSDDRWVFEQFLAISGVGPKLALGILSGIEVEALREAVRGEDLARLQSIPGVGRKTAERLILELRDRLFDPQGQAKGPDPAVTVPAASPGPGRPQLREDAVSALVNLGYTPKASRKAVDAAVDQDDASSLEDVLRRALSSLVR